MYKNVVHQKIGASIGHNPQSYGPSLPKACVYSGHNETHTHHCIENKKSVISLKPAVMVFLVVVFVKAPKETVHDVFVRKPGHKFHDTKGANKT